MDGKNIIAIKDGDLMLSSVIDTPPIGQVLKQPQLDGTVKKKRRRGKSKRKMMKPFLWQERRKNENKKRNNRFRKIVLAKTHAPFNNNQFLMEIHKPEPENTFQLLHTPSARTRDSSFSVDSEDNYFYSLPEDEEEYLTKEFSSVYEDAQSERLSNMSKNELVQEYLLLEAKYENLIKRTERSKPKSGEEDEEPENIEEISLTDRDSMITDRDTSGTSMGSSAVEEPSFSDILQRMKEQEQQIQELEMANEKLRLENDRLRQRPMESSSEDSESDSSSSSGSASSSSDSVVNEPAGVMYETTQTNGDHIHLNGQNEVTEDSDLLQPMVNGFHNPNE
ncbi:hypothetical protein K1T71_010865 [Dendrolimus kikuchii]|uniref:Uncharacterized protein n=1 Tax=Dendrolimus kikuchii TaxID=765133 RepID=A0ACC1CQ39_9NEOP|nr:hypothetical protein K1T71_010865 [Dendrolimus kikuchii]